MRAVQFSAGNVGEAGAVRRAIIRTVQQIVARLRALVTGQYRPEKHYMRGTGPKAREKQQAAFISPQA